MKTQLVPLALACLLVAAPATAQVNYGVSGNTAFVATSPNAAGDIVIASIFNGYPVTSIRDYAFLNRTGLTSVTIPASVTSIGGGAFLNCSNLTNVTFRGNSPGLYPDLEVGGFTQFVNTGAGAKAYYYCGTTGWGTNYGGLPTVMLCPAQVNYAVSGSTAYVTSSPNASGAIVIASTYNGYPVTGIQGYAFAGSTNLTSVTIPNSVTGIAGFAFTNCTSLTRVTIPNSVASIGAYAFSRCTSLPSVIIPNSVTNIGFKAFYTCTSLTSVTIPNSVTSIDPQAFGGCTSLTNLSVDAANPAYSNLNGVLFNKAQTALIIFPPGRGDSYVMPDSVTTIGFRAFYLCTRLTNVTVGNSVTSIGEHAFSLCTSLTSVTMGNSVTSIGANAFLGCGGLTRVTIPNSVTSIGRDAFIACTSLTNFTFLGNAPQLTAFDGRTFSSVGAGAKAYYYCGTTGWGATYGGLPTVMLCPPQIVPGSAGVKPGGFGFTFTRLTNQTIVVEASTNLVNWQPIWTNPPPGASTNFIDPEWLNHSNRFYRARSD